jgi:hypothetical protein
MKGARLGWLILCCFPAGCGTSPKVITPGSDVRSYHGTASVGDFLTIFDRSLGTDDHLPGLLEWRDWHGALHRECGWDVHGHRIRTGIG